MVSKTDKPRRTHRSQAERTADMRARLIDAAIACLFETGFAATSITTVAEEAGVSRGAVTHHFPAKTDLMVAVMEAVSVADGAEYEAQIAESSAVEWLNRLPAMMWGVISRPSGVAIMEIMLASRADPELAERLRAMQSAIYQRAQSFVARRHADAGMAPRADGHAIYRVMLAAIRGLALESVFMNSEEDVGTALGILTESFQLLNPSLPRPPER